MTARCAMGSWVTGAPDALCAEPLYESIGVGEYRLLECFSSSCDHVLDDEAWEAWNASMETWRRERPLCPPGLDVALCGACNGLGRAWPDDQENGMFMPTCSACNGTGVK